MVCLKRLVKYVMCLFLGSRLWENIPQDVETSFYLWWSTSPGPSAPSATKLWLSGEWILQLTCLWLCPPAWLHHFISWHGLMLCILHRSKPLERRWRPEFPSHHLEEFHESVNHPSRNLNRRLRLIYTHTHVHFTLIKVFFWEIQSNVWPLLEICL